MTSSMSYNSDLDIVKKSISVKNGTIYDATLIICLWDLKKKNCLFVAFNFYSNLILCHNSKYKIKDKTKGS